MALFGLFGNKTEGAPFKKHGHRATNKRAQAVDRWESIRVLAQSGTAEAVQALLPRFAFYVDPSITDQEEKDAAFAGVISAGPCAIEPVVEYLKRAESIAWPLKMLDVLCSADDVVTHLIHVLEDMDTEYERDPQKKIDVIVALGERSDPRVPDAVARFLADANETVRFSAVGAAFSRDGMATTVDALVECFLSEESVRVRNRIVDSLVEKAEPVPDALRARMSEKLPAGFELAPSGILRQR